MFYRFSVLFCLLVASHAVPNKRVMLWTTDDAANTNATILETYLAELQTVKDIVDVVSPCSYYIQQTEPHALIRKTGADTLHKALITAGFKVQPLVGDISGGWNMSWYRDTFASDAFVKAAVKEIKDGSLEGLNFVRDLNPGYDWSISLSPSAIVAQD